MKLRGQGRNEALHPVLCREVVVGKPGRLNGVWEGSVQWNESGYSCRGVNPACELNELFGATGSGEVTNGVRER